MSVYAGTMVAVRAISEDLRQEVGDKLRLTIVSPGMTRTNFADAITKQEAKARLEERRDKTEMPLNAIARAIAFAIGVSLTFSRRLGRGERDRSSASRDAPRWDGHRPYGADAVWVQPPSRPPRWEARQHASWPVVGVADQ